MTHKELIEIAYRWCLKNTSCGIAFKELECVGNGETPDVIGFSSWTYSVLIECKVSRSDFLCDKKKRIRIKPGLGMGKYRFYCCPTGLIKPEELPALWGLIYINENNKPRMIVNPFGKTETYINSKVYGLRGDGNEYNLEAEHQLLYSALRRLFIKGCAPMIYDKAYQRPDKNQIIERNKISEDAK